MTPEMVARHETARSMRAEGATLRVIGETLRVTPIRARQMLLKIQTQEYRYYCVMAHKVYSYAKSIADSKSTSEASMSKGNEPKQTRSREVTMDVVRRLEQLGASEKVIEFAKKLVGRK